MMDYEKFRKDVEGHTPGPWEINRYTNYEGYSIFAPGDGCIAERWYARTQPEDYEQRMRANARLVAAAPDLLRLLDESRALGLELTVAADDSYRLLNRAYLYYGMTDVPDMMGTLVDLLARAKAAGWL